MNTDNQIKHHLFWILFELGYLQVKDREEKYKRIMAEPLSEDTCKEIDALVQHIKETY